MKTPTLATLSLPLLLGTLLALPQFTSAAEAPAPAAGAAGTAAPATADSAGPTQAMVGAVSAATVARELKGIWVPIDKKAPFLANPPSDWSKYEKTTGFVRSTSVHIITTDARGSSVAALTGPVGVTFANGHDLLRVAPGTMVTFALDGILSVKTLAQIIKEAKDSGAEIKDNLMKAVQYFSDTVSQTSVLNGQNVTEVLIALVEVASRANPPGAAVYVKVAIDGIMKNPELSDTATGRNVITALVIGAVNAVGSKSGEAGDVLNAASLASLGTFSRGSLNYAIENYSPPPPPPLPLNPIEQPNTVSGS